MEKRKISNLHRYGDHGWAWTVENDLASGNNVDYRTNKYGEGRWYWSDYRCCWIQEAGTCQFSGCKTASGMRRKLRRIFRVGD